MPLPFLLFLLLLLTVVSAFAPLPTFRERNPTLFSYYGGEQSPQADDPYNEDAYYEEQQQGYYQDEGYPQEEYYEEQDQYHEEDQSPPPQEERLILTSDDVEQQLQSLQSKIPKSEADYLAAARKRAEEHRASINSGASDEDWQRMVQQQNDGWEQSLADLAGSEESQILIPKGVEQQQDGSEGDEDEEEPKLLLF